MKQAEKMTTLINEIVDQITDPDTLAKLNNLKEALKEVTTEHDKLYEDNVKLVTAYREALKNEGLANPDKKDLEAPKTPTHFEDVYKDFKNHIGGN